MDPETERTLNVFFESKDFDVEAISLWRAKAHEIRSDSPHDSLRILELVALKLLRSRFGSAAEKYAALDEASSLGREIGRESSGIQTEAAKLAASLGDYGTHSAPLETLRRRRS